MLKISKIISSKSKNSEYLKLFHFLKWMFQNLLIKQQTCVEMANVLWSIEINMHVFTKAWPNIHHPLDTNYESNVIRLWMNHN
jgi:hypothetical protein